jgi:hypothetical protein
MRFILLVLGAAGLLSGCASSQRLVDVVGSWPDRAESASFSLDFARPDAASFGGAPGPVSDADIPALVSRRLVERGMTPADGAPARYLVEIAYSARPAIVGAGLELTPSAPGAQPAWLDSPAPKRGWVRKGRSQICTLTLRFSETATDREILRLHATEVSRKARCAEAGSRLVDAALSELPPTSSRL